jgi:Uma2 family endonuclease
MSLETPDRPIAVEYPASDGEPMAETDVHRRLMSDLIFELSNFFKDDPDVYVSGNLLLYYVEGNPGKRVAPDVFVARGVGKRARRVYKLWEERAAPDVVIELSSRQTWREDVDEKFELYQELGIKEYFLFDPEYDYLIDSLVGYRLEEGRYSAIKVMSGKALIESLGLELVDTGETLRIFDPRSGLMLPTPEEHAEASLRAEEASRLDREACIRAEEASRLDREACIRAEEASRLDREARIKAESETARLREELERLKRPKSN